MEDPELLPIGEDQQTVAEEDEKEDNRPVPPFAKLSLHGFLLPVGHFLTNSVGSSGKLAYCVTGRDVNRTETIECGGKLECYNIMSAIP